jgi:CyaY protein
MTDGEYKTLADALFMRLEEALDRVDAGLDYDLAVGGVLEIEFDDGSMIVVNRQSPLHEIWVAARGGGFHYRWDGASWRDTRSGEELLAALSRLGSEQARMPIVLA